MTKSNPPKYPLAVKPEILKMYAERRQCIQCKHNLSEPILLPVKKPVPGKFQPNISAKFLWHMKETHGIPPEVYREWIIGSVYGMELGLFGIKGVQHDTID